MCRSFKGAIWLLVPSDPKEILQRFKAKSLAVGQLNRRVRQFVTSRMTPIKAHLNAFLVFPFLCRSSALRTVSSFGFNYGRVEIRAKLPKGDWIWPVGKHTSLGLPT